MLHCQTNLLLRRFTGRIILYNIRLVLGERTAAADAPIDENEAAAVPDRPIRPPPSQGD